MEAIRYPIKGSCQCGAVSYRLLAPPQMVVACHCKECQKLSTSAFSITAIVRAEDVEFSGELSHWQRGSASGNISAAKFCGRCGNRIYHYNPAEPQSIKLKPSNLEDTRIIQPSAHAWVSEKQDWFVIPPGVKQYTSQP